MCADRATTKSVVSVQSTMAISLCFQPFKVAVRLLGHLWFLYMYFSFEVGYAELLYFSLVSNVRKTPNVDFFQCQVSSLNVAHILVFYHSHSTPICLSTSQALESIKFTGFFSLSLITLFYILKFSTSRDLEVNPPFQKKALSARATNLWPESLSV